MKIWQVWLIVSTLLWLSADNLDAHGKHEIAKHTGVAVFISLTITVVSMILECVK